MTGGKSDGCVVSMKRRNCHGEKATTRRRIELREQSPHSEVDKIENGISSDSTTDGFATAILVCESPLWGAVCVNCASTVLRGAGHRKGPVYSPTVTGDLDSCRRLQAGIGAHG